MDFSHPFFLQSNLEEDLCAVLNSQYDIISVNDHLLGGKATRPNSFQALFSEEDHQLLLENLQKTAPGRLHRFQANTSINAQSRDIVWTFFHDQDSDLIYVSGLIINKVSPTKVLSRSRLQDTLARFEGASEMTSIGYWDMDLVTQKLEWSRMTRKIHEVPDDFVPDVEKAIGFYEEGEHRDKITELFRRCAEEGLPSTNEFEIITYTGTKKWVIASGLPEYKNGVVVKVYGLFQDISASKNNEQRLEAALAEKTVLFKELHHRVKNNLHMVISLLFLKSTVTENQELKDFIIETQNRIKSIAKTHNLLLHLQELDELYTKKYLEELVSEIVASLTNDPSRYPLNLDIADVKLHVDTILSLGLLTNEIVSNVIKHAYLPETGGPVNLQFSCNKDNCSFIISDHGSGFQPDAANNHSIGLLIVDQLVKSISGELTRKSDDGTQYTIKFPKPAKS